jgi:AcrR family transcriptional regulator
MDGGIREPVKASPRKRAARPRTKREQRLESYEKLLAAARDLFLASGYRATTLEQVSGRAGLTKGAVYFHFRSKERLLLALLARVDEQVVKPIIAALTSAGDSAADKLVKFVHIHAELGLSHRDDMMLLIAMSIEFSKERGPVQARIKQIYQHIYDQLEDVVRAGQRKGELRRNAPAREIASVLIANHDGTLLEWYRRGSQLSGDSLVRAVRVIMVEGIIVSKR